MRAGVHRDLTCEFVFEIFFCLFDLGRTCPTLKLPKVQIVAENKEPLLKEGCESGKKVRRGTLTRLG
ncbi:MAG: hypothetical protein ACXVIA_02540 [Halobacteriota archaeon]